MTTETLLETHRVALTGHCYRMLGSVVDAEDAVQEAMLRAWKGFDRFDARSSVRTWLYRIATNVCIDMLTSADRTRMRPLELGDAPGVVRDGMALPQRPREAWVEPAPTATVVPADAATSPDERAILRESVRLAFVAALQYLPPRQRAALLLTQVLGFPAADAADVLEMTVPALNSALQRARATLDARNPAVMARPLTPEQQALAERYVAAFERYDVDALKAILHEEATLSMPPYELWLQGHDAIGTWFLTYGIGCRGSRLVPVEACGGLAFAQYRDGGATPWAIILLETDGERITSQTSYLDVETLFPRFGLGMRL